MGSIMQIHLIDQFNRRFAARHTGGTVRRIANGLAALVAVLATGILTSSPASAQTNLTFQQNVSAYTGVLDTRIVSSSASPLNTEATSIIDGGGTTFMDASWTQGLFSFSDLFGGGSSQIPLNATITSATLTITTDNAGNSQSNNSFGIYRLNSGFTAGTTWGNSFGGDGIQVGVETAAADDTKVGGPQLGTVAFNVLSSMNFWKSQPDANAANFGWAVSTIAGTDGWIVRMSENASASSRPLLSVTYLIPANLTWNAANTTGTWDSGNGANQVWINDTTTLAASFNNTDNVSFSQNPASQVDITVAGVSPSTMTVSHTSGTYAFSGGSINSLLTKTGNGTLVLNASNTFSSANLSGGIVEVVSHCTPHLRRLTIPRWDLHSIQLLRFKLIPVIPIKFTESPVETGRSQKRVQERWNFVAPPALTARSTFREARFSWPIRVDQAAI
jgi:autotransporter-associated beta strand protein